MGLKAYSKVEVSTWISGVTNSRGAAPGKGVGGGEQHTHNFAKVAAN